MYSIVLMAAIGSGPGASGADQPGAVVAAPHGVAIGCGGCTGCSGYVASGCSGSCHGRGGFLGRRNSCNGCGGMAYSSCHGYGGGFGHRQHSCHGCGGSCSGFVAGCWGSCSGYGCSGSVYGSYVHPTYAVPVHTGAAPFYYTPGIHSAPPVVIPQAKPEVEKKAGASLKFNLPAGAVLFVDGQKTPGEAAERAFYTPPLEAGQKYFYDVRAEIAIAGRTVVEEKRVVVEAGAEIRESFPKVIAAVAAATTVAGK